MFCIYFIVSTVLPTNSVIKCDSMLQKERTIWKEINYGIQSTIGLNQQLNAKSRRPCTKCCTHKILGACNRMSRILRALKTNDTYQSIYKTSQHWFNCDTSMSVRFGIRDCAMVTVSWHCNIKMDIAQIIWFPELIYGFYHWAGILNAIAHTWRHSVIRFPCLQSTVLTGVTGADYVCHEIELFLGSHNTWIFDFKKRNKMIKPQNSVWAYYEFESSVQYKTEHNLTD